MEQVEGEPGPADIVSEKFGAFRPTAVTEKDLDWVDALNSDQGGKGKVVLRFTTQGGEKLKSLFLQSNGKTIGVFVRGVLMSLKKVDATDNKDSILIDGIPNADLARIFADDVNTGLHVQFVRQN
jgi:hypothetical protein